MSTAEMLRIRLAPGRATADNDGYFALSLTVREADALIALCEAMEAQPSETWGDQIAANRRLTNAYAAFEASLEKP